MMLQQQQALQQGKDLQMGQEAAACPQAGLEEGSGLGFLQIWSRIRP
jgi:hypothetical protein